MPLLRVEVRNEYALGAPELYRDVNNEDPKELLEGVAVAGLVGVLRQLGDLAEFAAEVFHSLQEEVTITSSRSHKLKTRVQRIEAALSPLEKAVLAQRSHLHFAYTAGSNWRTRIRCKENHFIYSDVPQAIMDSYEGCRSPPRLHLLDRFDPEGPGSCLKRYSDPTFFKRASTASGEPSTEKILHKKSRKIKKRRSHSNREVSRDTSYSYHSGRMRFSQPVGVHTSPSQTMSTYDATRSDLGEQSNLDLRSGSDYIDGDFRPSYSIQEQESRESITSPVKRRDSDFLDYTFFEEKTTDAYNDIQINLSQEQAGCSSSSVTWDEKTETLEPTLQYDHNNMINQKDHDGMIREKDHDGMIREKDHDGMIDEEHHDDMIKEQDHVGFIKEKNHDCMIKNENHDGMIKDENHDDMIKQEDYDNMIKEEDHDENIQSVSPNSERKTLVDKALDFGAVDKIYSQPFGQVVQTVESGDVHHNEIESETDQFMDALNTIESESETDVDCPRKPTMELLEDKIVDGGEHELIRHNLDYQSTNSESKNLTKSSLINGNDGDNVISPFPKYPNPCDSSINGVETTEDPTEDPSSISLVDKGLQSTKKVGESLDPGSSRSIGPHENGNCNGEASMESISSEISPNLRDDGPVMPIIDATRSRPESEKHAPETSNVTSVTFWTNGGLLGLQPSKPPDFNILNGPSSKKDENISCSIQNASTSDKDPRNLDQTESFRNIEENLDTDYSEYPKSGASFRKVSWKISPTVLDIKLGKSGDSLHSNNASSTKAIQTTSGNSVPIISELEAFRKPQENGRISSRMFELGNRVLSNGCNETILPSEQNGQNVAYRTISGRTKGLFGGEPLVLSPNSSPPLGHMKISFQPLHGYEASKLKLQFPEENTNNESSRDIFPSFQLVPELSIAHHRIGSDSDDDTFYRSSPSLSNDCHSPQSGSDSEQWESGESRGSKDHDVYDALHRMSLDESVSTVSKNGTSNLDLHDNGFQNSLSCRSFDLHSLDTLSHSFKEDLRSYADPKDLVVPRFAPSPALPPLPPVQWRGLDPNLGGAENNSKAMSEGSKHAFEKLSAFTISQQPKPAPLNQDEMFGASNLQKSKQSLLKPVVRREPNRSKSMNERDDFLHQIRTKALNLRPTGKLKPSETSEGSGKVQVVAILEKANAIRQAVGSDDDGNWSET